jgi:hypothetical protein
MTPAILGLAKAKNQAPTLLASTDVARLRRSNQ